MWKKALFGTASACLVGYVVWISYLSPIRHEVEWDVATRVTAALQSTGFEGVIPVVDGRDVELRGSVPSASEAERAQRIVRMIRGVRAVRTQVLVVGDGRGGGDT